MWGRVVDQEIPRNPMCCSSLCKVVGCQTQLTSMKLDSIREIYLKIWKKKHPWEIHLFRVSSKKKNPNECFHKFATYWKRTPPLTKNPQKVSVFVVFLVRISLHSDWIRSHTEDICPFSLNAGKYGPAKLQIRTIFKQCDFRTFSHNISSETLWLQ